MDDTKICKDCAHFRRFWPAERLSKCAATKDRVTGGPEKFCGLSRQYGPCNAEGSLWEPSPRRWWQFWRSA
jgi:hypothetical protein